MNTTILRLRALQFSGHRGNALAILEAATLKRHPLTKADYWAACSEMGWAACPICLSPFRQATQCSNGYCACHTLPEGEPDIVGRAVLYYPLWQVTAMRQEIAAAERAVAAAIATPARKQAERALKRLLRDLDNEVYAAGSVAARAEWDATHRAKLCSKWDDPRHAAEVMRVNNR